MWGDPDVHDLTPMSQRPIKRSFPTTHRKQFLRRGHITTKTKFSIEITKKKKTQKLLTTVGCIVNDLDQYDLQR